MSFIKPTRPKVDPESRLVVPGQYWAKCIEVRQGEPHHRFPGKTMIAIEFEIVDKRYPDLKGKRTAIVAQETVYVDPETGRPSHLLAHARMMGVVGAERGFDPQAFVGRIFYVNAEAYNGQCYVRSAVPAAEGTITGNKVNPPPPPKAPPPLIDGDDVPY